ncbi:MerR family transcriptional regulator [Oryzobacter telluris]|uniref:MerR family transcriptional regulator n=1 Tax=Oryzobacter telluris TaxID=3149179 RepID=UPI00370D40CF
MRIGELATRVGVSTHVLRAWESRYGLLQPIRSAGGYRLYGPEDERRVRDVVALRDQGVSAVEAARRVLAAERAGVSALDPSREIDSSDGYGAGRGTPPPGVDTGRAPASLRSDPPMLVAQLLDAVSALDEDRAHAVLDTAFLERSVESAIIDVVLPLLRRIGEMWELGRIGIAQEHFASSLLRRRLGALSLTWGVGSGPVAVLACPPGEFHDIVLLSFGVLLGRAGWRIRYLGPDTPVHSLAGAAKIARADAVVLASRRPSGFRAHAKSLSRLGKEYPLWLAGRGATPRVLEEVGVELLGPDLLASVTELTARARAQRLRSEDPTLTSEQRAGAEPPSA